ncbi:hypothetical protein [Paenibacillus sp. 1001270B_150601_E10]|uniref:hypothetical protein n=1 Tax=Paenibacillus sp. 1001270B_150601_E10 TaxID=2787079 RepID=UPI00189E4384|nr:hypothetical protein [Paenibacillus sp. 1001270B_150601_E10]
MSLFSFIVSNRPLPEIDQTGFVRMKARELKKLNIQAKGPIDIHELDDDVDVMYAKDEAKINDLRISRCTNPPYDLEQYINKEYIYWLEGDRYRESWNSQLFEYLNEHKDHVSELEIWSIWFGDGIQEINETVLSLHNVTLLDLERLKGSNFCIKFV